MTMEDYLPYRATVRFLTHPSIQQVTEPFRDSVGRAADLEAIPPYSNPSPQFFSRGLEYFHLSCACGGGFFFGGI